MDLLGFISIRCVPRRISVGQTRRWLWYDNPLPHKCIFFRNTKLTTTVCLMKRQLGESPVIYSIEACGHACTFISQSYVYFQFDLFSLSSHLFILFSSILDLSVARLLLASFVLPFSSVRRLILVEQDSSTSCKRLSFVYTFATEPTGFRSFRPMISVSLAAIWYKAMERGIEDRKRGNTCFWDSAIR